MRLGAIIPCSAGTIARPKFRSCAMPRADSVQQVFDAMPAHFLPDQAPGINAIVQFDLSGEAGGQWYATIANGSLQVSTGQAPNPNLTLSTSAQNYLAIINGELKPM